jgi:hypothetical protein
MSVTSADQLGGLLVAVISGGRPALRERPVNKYLPDLEKLGVGAITWVVSERDAALYEQGRYPITEYPRDWAEYYAGEHWMNTTPPEPGGFLGAFPGREWACLEAERLGCWGVLQLDDNIIRLSFVRGGKGSIRMARDHGGMGLFADLLAAVALSTNSRMTGSAMDATLNNGASEWKVARAGFPYSLFIERVGPDREHWYGPVEDDITHAVQYGTRADGATAAVMPFLKYSKESKSKSGMRSAYNHTRAVQLQRIFPESAKITVRKTKANGRGEGRVFHTMLPGAIRNPLAVHDPDLFGAVKARLTELTEEWSQQLIVTNRAKVLARAAKANGPVTTTTEEH